MMTIHIHPVESSELSFTEKLMESMLLPIHESIEPEACAQCAEISKAMDADAESAINSGLLWLPTHL